MQNQRENISRALRLPKVCDLVGYAPASIWRKVKNNEFPAPYRLGENAIAWDEREVLQWLEVRKSTRVQPNIGGVK